MGFQSLMPHLATLTQDQLEETSGQTRTWVLGTLTPTQKQVFQLLGVNYR